MKRTQNWLLFVLLIILVSIQASLVYADSLDIHKQQSHPLMALSTDTLSNNDKASDKKHSDGIRNCRMHMQPDASSAKNKSLPPVASLANTQCPVCKMELEGILVDTTYYNFKLYGFCASHCKAKFKSNPKLFVR